MSKVTLKSFFRIKSARSKLAKEYASYVSSNAGSIDYYLSDVDIDAKRGRRIIKLGRFVINRRNKEGGGRI
jgi:hypothetical protein